VAKINPIKLKQEADKHEKAGRLDQAIASYGKLVEANPRDWNSINKIGDLYAKLNKAREASQEYAKVAEFYAKDGFLLKAIAIWKKINKLDASSLDPYLKLAELYSKQGLMMEAKGQFQVVVDEYVKRGKNRDAAGVLNKMVEIDPGDLKVRSKLADLYTRDGSTSKALGEYVAIAEELNKKGHLAEALQVLEKGLRLDAKSNRIREELARIHLLQKNYDKAAYYLEEAVRNAPDEPGTLNRLGEAYLGAQKIEEAEAIFRRLLELNPSDQEARIQMARVQLVQGQFDRAFEGFLPVVDELLERQEGEKAAALLQQLVQKNSSHVKSLNKLVEIYRVAQNDRGVAAIYGQLTEAYLSLGQYEQSAAVLEILISMDPENGQYKSKLDFVRSKYQAVPAPAPPPSLEVGADELEGLPPLEDGPPLVLEEEPAGPELAAPVAIPQEAGSEALERPAIHASGPLSDEDSEFIEEHLAEGRVFRKYGLVDKAADQFESIVARFPDNVDARKELNELYCEKNQPEKAAEHCLALAEICRLGGRGDEAEAHEAEARRLAPHVVPTAPAAAPAVPPPPEEEEIPFGEEEVAFGGDVGVEAGGFEGPFEEEVVESELGDIGLTLEEETESDLGGLEVEEEEEEIPDVGELSEGGLVLEGLPPVSAEELLPLEAPAAPAPLRAAPARPGVAPAANLPMELQKALEEVDSYISLGFVDDAREALRQIGGQFPGHPALLDKIGELGLDQEVAAPVPPPGPDPAQDDVLGELDLSEPPPFELSQPSSFSPAVPEPQPPAPAPEPESIDLGAELGELFGAQSAVEEPVLAGGGTDLGDAGLSEIFRQFRKGVDQQLGEEDYDTRYNLGIAYKEMELVDEAIAEFQIAAKDESRLLECSSMLGICFMDKGMPKLAVKWFEKGLQAPGRTEEEYQGLRYDLAAAYEAGGERDRAFGLYSELYGQNSDFRNVAAKVRELQS
jgi:pilus assembly protein FimV